MKFNRHVRVLAVAVTGALTLYSVADAPLTAQQAQESSVPSLVQFSGRIADPAGRPIAGVIDLTFAFYASEDATEPLWSEMQSVLVGDGGQYAVMLGAASTDGIPRSLFASGEARWLGVKTSEGLEQPRLLLLSVPYALKAGDAETLGGKPASAYLLANELAPSAAAGATTEGSSVRAGDPLAAAAQGEPVINGTGTANFIAKFQSTDEIRNSGIFENASGNIGIGTTNPGLSKLVLLGNTAQPAMALTQSGAGGGIFATSTGGGTALAGVASATAGSTTAVEALNLSTAGTAIVGSANATSGATRGVVGSVNSPGGIAGVFDNIGGGNLIVGQVSGAQRFRVDGAGSVTANGEGMFNSGVTGFGGPTLFNANGVRGETTSTTAAGVFGSNIASTGAGVRGNGQIGVEGIGVGSSGSGIKGQGAIGVEGFGSIWGVTGSTNTAGARGVRGAYNGPGLGYGVEAEAASTAGIALQAWSSNATGNTIGVRGMVSSPNGVGGVFDNTAGGTILQGNENGALRFKVDTSGAVFASSYRDLAGNPIPGGDLTGVIAGVGLAGGGTSGDVTLSLDTAFTDGRYAPVVHGHDVSQVTNAATLGSNSFSGLQSIAGGVTITSSGSEAARATSTATSGMGLVGIANSSNGTGVRGEGAGFGVLGSSTAIGGSGLWGVHSSTGSGFGAVGLVAASAVGAVGVQGINFSNSGVGVRGVAVKAGATAGVFDNIEGGNILVGQVNEVQRFKVDGSGAVYASSYRDLAGNPIPSGNGDITAVAAGTGLAGGGVAGDVTLALDTAFTDNRYSLLGHGHTVSQVSGAATLGANTFTGNQNVTGNLSATGEISGVSSAQGARALRGDASGLSGVGVEGNATGEAGEGVRGIATGFDGLGIQGLATHSTGPATGVAGSSSSSEGIGVLGTGHTGVRGDSTHPGGVAGLFTTAGTDLLRGEVSDTTKFRVDGTGAVYASEYRDLAGNPIPSGTGDITSVAAGAGLVGGGVAGDVSLAIDTAFTDGRYSLLGHGHTVSQVSGAATLAANNFTGTQSVTGDVIATGKVEGVTSATGQHGVRGTGTGSLGFGVRGDATGSLGAGVFGTFNGANGSGVRGASTATTGVGTGVRGASAADFGTGLYGEATSTVGQGIGTRGQTSSPNGMGVMGYANAATGQPIGVRAVVESTGIAGTFENVTGSGDLIVGRTGPISGVYTNRFRVDTSGNVYAGSYRDLAGNPIPSGNGDVTAVAAGTGLAGGGTTGDVSVALDTTFTDARYALAAHGHDVSQVANAARLSGGNMFTGSQNMSGTDSQPLLIVTNSSGGGIYGQSGSLPNPGVRGAGPRTGVVGEVNSSSGTATGVFGQVLSSSGVAVHGQSTSSTGATTGVLATVASASGVAGAFENSAAGDLLIGKVQGAQKFRVDGTGAVYASSYRDLAGNPIPTGTEDITAVAAGSGLTGGGVSGDVTVALDTGFTDGRYARVSHGHDVSEIANAASLGSNTFSGSQTINGSVGVSGALTAMSSVGAGSITTTLGTVAGVNTSGAGVVGRSNGWHGVVGHTTAGHAGVFGYTETSGAIGVMGHSSYTGTGTIGYGVAGFSDGPGSIAVWGSTSAAIGTGVGVKGSANSDQGIAVLGEATRNTGSPIGVQGVVRDGTSGSAVRGIHQSLGSLGVGVYGSHAGSGWGVNGTTANGIGIRGYASGSGGTGVFGFHESNEGSAAGVLGQTLSSDGTAGIFVNSAATAATSYQGDILAGNNGESRVFRVTGNGQVLANGGFQASGADFAELVEAVGGLAEYEPGDVMEIDLVSHRTVRRSSTPYSSRVAGIYSTKPGLVASPRDIDDPRRADDLPLAVVGIVPCKVTDENGPIEPGDLLVASSRPGYAMKGTDRGRMLGAVVGKALEPLQEGTGVILVLVTLQ